MQHFSARQIAADLFKVKGVVRGLRLDRRPVTSRLGCDAISGHYMVERADGVPAHLVTGPKELPYQEQTETCEYGKLVRRLSFPDKSAAKY